MGSAIVIGGGIGGLAAAIALRRAGVEVAVYERADRIDDVGAGIALWANALHALEQLGLERVTRAAGRPYTVGGLRTLDGAFLTRASMGELERRFPIPVTVLHRADLVAALFAAIGPERVRLGVRGVGFEQDERSVTAHFADGRRAAADVLIGADGLNSVVRAQLHGDRPPTYAGCTAWRAVVPFDVQRVRAGETWGHGAVFGHVPLGGERGVYWYATRNTPEGGRATNEKAELLRSFEGWHEPIEALIQATDERAILRNDIYDRPVLQTWGAGRVTLLGDAAHPMLPYLGQGGCQALEDAVVLGKCLRGGGDVVQALRSYEAVRIPRANSLVIRSRRVGRVAQLENRTAVRLRNAVLRRLGPRMQVRQLASLIGYRA